MMMTVTAKKLAIVIPAYKEEFLSAALESLANQDNQNFIVYVGDDASLVNLKGIVDQFLDRLDINYHRFSDNLGGSSLVQQWNRCVRLSKEPWVWLFSDDDLAAPTCVSEFFNAINSTKSLYSVYRFNSVRIDSDDEIFCINPPHPTIETAFQFLYHRLKCQRRSYAPDYIFSRKEFDIKGGFVEFPLAWCSDDASWILFSLENGIYTMQKSEVYWRFSGQNITGDDCNYAPDKLKASGLFNSWVRESVLPHIEENSYCSYHPDQKLDLHCLLMEQKKVKSVH